MKNIDEQIKSVEREIALRKRCYPKFIGEERMEKEFAAHELDCMYSVFVTLKNLKAKEEGGLFLK